MEQESRAAGSEHVVPVAPWGEQDASEPLRLLRSRLRAPRPGRALVQRRGLLARLCGSRERLVLVSAPAGAGKTLLLLQWVETDGRPVGWLQADAADNDRAMFLTYLATALDPLVGVEPEIFSMLRSSYPPIDERVLPMLLDAVAGAPPFVFVLDEADRLTDPRCWGAVAALADSLPDGAQLALGTRADPPLPLARLRAAGALLEVGSASLAFDREEAAALIRGQEGAADDEVIDALLAATEGWATGISLGALVLPPDRPEDWAAGLRGDQHEIAAYLAAEVLDRQPEDVQRFLLETAVADRLSPALCRALTGREDAGRLLARLARANLFVTPLDEHDEWFRYHHLLAGFLRAELERRRPDDLPGLHRAAASWFLAHGDLDAAIRHLLAAGDTDDAAQVVTREWTRCWDRGQIETVRRWLRSFAGQDVLARPALALTAGWVFSAVGDADEAARWGRAACSVRVEDEPSPDGAASLISSQALLRATLAPDGVTAMRKDAELAARIEARRGSSWHVDAQLALGVARWLGGAPQQAIRPLAMAMREGAVFNQPVELAAFGYLALIAQDDEQWEAAREYEDRARRRLAELGFGSNRRSLPMLLAVARQAAHDGVAADDVAARVDEVLARLTPHVWLRLLGEITLGEVALARGDGPEADRRRAQAQRLLAEYPDAGVLRKRLERLRKAVEQLRLTEPLTAAELRVLELLPTHLTEAQMAARLFVSRNTVKTHLRGLYRKLAVSSRADAVERARELGLLKA